jgi:phage terminase small subunit
MNARQKGKRLTTRDRLFVAEYCVDLDPQRAAKAAGYRATVAKTKAYQWVSNSEKNEKPEVYEAIQKRLKAKTDKLEIKGEKTMRLIHVLGHHDPRKLFEKSDLKDISDLDLETAQTIAGFDFVNLYEGDGEQKHNFGQLRKIKLVDRLRALEMEARHFGLLANEQPGPVKVQVDVTTHYIGTPPSADVTVKVIPALPGGNDSGRHK